MGEKEFRQIEKTQTSKRPLGLSDEFQQTKNKEEFEKFVPLVNDDLTLNDF